jgi:hypothetical protein
LFSFSCTRYFSCTTYLTCLFSFSSRGAGGGHMSRGVRHLPCSAYACDAFASLCARRSAHACACFSLSLPPPLASLSPSLRPFLLSLPPSPSPSPSPALYLSPSLVLARALSVLLRTNKHAPGHGASILHRHR